ncbi:MAG: DUF1428 family protein [Chloroflexi bacterium]|nr:DUF1428 family protein [Chloroflexota bacterium]
MFEIRNYHFEPMKFDEYKKWAETTHAVLYLKGKMDVVGFWVNNEMAPIYGGSLPLDENVRPANITWIIRWQDRAQRDQVWEELHSDPAWQAIMSQVPGGRESYLRTEVKFATEI